MYHIVVFKSKETVSDNNRIILVLPTNRLPMPSTYWDVCCLVGKNGSNRTVNSGGSNCNAQG
jgi:hypothetical protein